MPARLRRVRLGQLEPLVRQIASGHSTRLPDRLGEAYEAATGAASEFPHLRPREGLEKLQPSLPHRRLTVLGQQVIDAADLDVEHPRLVLP